MYIVNMRQPRNSTYQPIGGAPPPPPPTPPTASARAELRRREVDAASHVAKWVQSHSDAVASTADDANDAILALADEKVLAGLLYELDGRVRTAKAHLRRFFRVVSNYHSAVRVQLDKIRDQLRDQLCVQLRDQLRDQLHDQLRRAGQAEPPYHLYIREHLKRHDEIGGEIDRLRNAWTASCRRMGQAVREPLLHETIRHGATCVDFAEFLGALLQRHESIADVMEDELTRR